MAGQTPADRYEIDVANYINGIPNVSATRPKVSSKYSDIVLTFNGVRTWLEVKMNHTDNLGNTRVSFDGEKWIASSSGPIAQFSTKLLSESAQALSFLEDLGKHSNKTFFKIPTTRGGIKEPDVVPLEVMRSFFDDRLRYIVHEEDVDLGELVTQHYLTGKEEPAHYMQAGDDFYMIGADNPCGLSSDIPVVTGRGVFKMRISTRSAFYEVVPEIKIRSLPSSPYSCAPGTLKPHPF